MAAQETPDPTIAPWIPPDTFAVRLGGVRVALGGLNIKEAATLCGFNPESWRRWEDGTMPRNLDEVCWQIAEATGLDYSWLMLGGPLTPMRGPGTGSRTGSFPSGLFALPEPSGDQGALLDDDGYPLDFWSRPFLTPV